jgi:hypothetical protein
VGFHPEWPEQSHAYTDTFDPPWDRIGCALQAVMPALAQGSYEFSSSGPHGSHPHVIQLTEDWNMLG